MGNIPLKPLTPDDNRKIPKFAVCDIESMNWIDFLVIGLAWKLFDDDDQEIDKQYRYFLDIGEFCDFVFSDEFPCVDVFAHFGGRFDFSFLIKEYFKRHQKSIWIDRMIPRGSSILNVPVHTFTREKFSPESEKDILARTKDGHFLVKKKTIIFRDSAAMLPFGLASLTENFGVEHKKQEMDHSKVTGVTPELLEYLEYDCWGLYECILAFFKWPVIRRCGASFTVASQSIKVLRSFLKDDIKSLNSDTSEFVRESYFGGRTEIFKPFFEQNKDDFMLNSYDVNSLYPAVMRDFEYPSGLKKETLVYLENQIGFYEVEVEVPDMYIPPLGMRYEGMDHRLIFPTGKFRGIWSTAELNYAQSIGVKINRVFRGAVFKSGGKFFKPYIDYLYDLRKKSKRDSVDNVLCKLLMNSTYGRFGLNLGREQLVFDQGQHGVLPFMEIPVNGEKEVIRLMIESVELESSFTNVAVAAMVTSYARILMHKLYSRAPDDIYYTDTDSMFTTFKYPRNDQDLGQLKLEGRFKRGAFLLPKTYMVESTTAMFKLFDDEAGRERKDMKTTKKVVMKGFDRKKLSKFTWADFIDGVEGDYRRLQVTNPKKFATFKTAVKKNEFLMLLNESPKQLRSRYNKRKIVKRAYSQVYDTEPLHIKNGKIQNLDKDLLKKWKTPTFQELDALALKAISKLKKEGKM